LVLTREFESTVREQVKTLQVQNDALERLQQESQEEIDALREEVCGKAFEHNRALSSLAHAYTHKSDICTCTRARAHKSMLSSCNHPILAAMRLSALVSAGRVGPLADRKSQDPAASAVRGDGGFAIRAECGAGVGTLVISIVLMPAALERRSAVFEFVTRLATRQRESTIAHLVWRRWSRQVGGIKRVLSRLLVLLAGCG